jgi:hypothetical protein
MLAPLTYITSKRKRMRHAKEDLKNIIYDFTELNEIYLRGKFEIQRNAALNILDNLKVNL